MCSRVDKPFEGVFDRAQDYLSPETVVTGVVQTFWKRGGSTLAAVSQHGVLGLLAYVGLDLLKLAFERSGLIHLLYIFLHSPLFLSVWVCFSISSGHLIVGLDLASLSSLFPLFTVHVTFVGDSKRERTGRKKLRMAEEMAAPASDAPPAATDHEFTSHQEGPAPVPLNNASRRSTLSKSYLDVNVRGTTTPHSVNRHSHMGDIALENYFVCFSNLQFQCRKLCGEQC
jgi:hypothetical protein